MQKNEVIKWGHRALTSVLLILVVISGLILYADKSPRNDLLYSKKQLSDDMWIYVTKYQDAGATDSDVYRYYLNKQLDNPMPVIQKTGAFLQADTGQATINAIGNHVLIRLTGKVYSYSNSAFYYDGDIPVVPRIDLNAYAGKP